MPMCKPNLSQPEAERTAKSFAGSRLFLRRRVLLSVLGLVLFSVFARSHSDELTVTGDKVVYPANTAKTSLSYLSLENDAVLTQSLTADYELLDSTVIALYSVPADMTGTFSFELTGSDGAVLASREVPAHTLTDGTFACEGDTAFFSVGPLGLKLTPGREYRLSIVVRGNLSSPPKVKTFIRIENERLGDLGAMTVGGEPSDNRLYIDWLVYRTTQYKLPILAGCFLLFLLTLWIPLPRKGKKAQEIICTVLLPAALFAAFEFAAGSLGGIRISCVLWSLLLLELLLIACHALCGGPGVRLYMLTGSSLALINYFVTLFRGTPISFSDFAAVRTAAAVAGGYTYTLSPECAEAAFLLAAAMALWHRSHRSRGRKHPAADRKHLHAAELRAGCAVGCLAACLCTARFLPLRTYNEWTVQNNYRSYGWLYSNLLELRLAGMRAPKDYSAQKAKTVLQNADAALEGEGSAIQPTNLIVVMNETFSDPGVLGGFSTDRDYLPYFYSLADEAELGLLQSPVLGGGTSCTEWEFLTGCNKILGGLTLTPYENLYNGKYAADGLCSELKQLGYTALAMHPCLGENWNRDSVYTMMGFDRFLTIDDFESPETLRGYVTDAADYRRIFEICEDKAADEPLFLFNVTMQNHGGYGSNLDLSADVHWLDGTSAEVDNYLSLIRRSDDALKQLIEYFRQVDEPTMIVLFGDHQPQLDDAFYRHVFGLDERDTEQKEQQYTTPYLIWTNYDSPAPQSSPGRLSANYFGAYVKLRAGLPLTDYERYVLRCAQEIPVIGHYGVYDSSLDYHPYTELPDELSQKLDEMKAVQYYRLTRTAA